MNKKKRRPRHRFLIIVSVIFCVLIIVGIFKYKSALYQVGDFLIVTNPAKPSDVIIVLAGNDMKERVIYGAELYKQGYATKVIMSGGPRYWNSTAAADMSKHAVSLGLPPESILLEETSQTTYQNALYCLELMRDHDFKSSIVVTSPFHTKRTRIIFSKLFKANKLDFTICTFEDDRSRQWWHDETRAHNIANEYLKLIWYYLFVD